MINTGLINKTHKKETMRKLILVALLLSGITALAQDQDRKERREHMQNLSPEQMATLQTKRMTLALDLTDAQQSKVKNLFVKNAEERKAKMDAYKSKKESGAKLTDDEKFAMQNERLDKEIAHKKEMKSILNDEQYTKWKKMRHRKGMHKKGMHKKGKESKRREKK